MILAAHEAVRIIRFGESGVNPLVESTVVGAFVASVTLYLAPIDVAAGFLLPDYPLTDDAFHGS